MKGGTFLLQFINILVAGLSLDHMALFGILSPVRIGRIYIIRPTYLWRLKVRPKICRPNKLIPMETVLNLKLYLHFWCIRINRMTYNLYHITIPFLLQEFNLCPFTLGTHWSFWKVRDYCTREEDLDQRTGQPSFGQHWWSWTVGMMGNLVLGSLTVRESYGDLIILRNGLFCRWRSRP